MAFYFPEGTRLQFSTTLAAPRTITGISNADPAVATAVGHGYVDGNFVLYEGAWDEIDECVIKVDQLTADTFGLVGLDATDTAVFPSGSGAGTAKLISNWTDMPQLSTMTRDGGTPITADVPLLARRSPVRVTVGQEPTNFNFALVWDPANATYRTLLSLSRRRAKVAFRALISGSAPLVGYGTFFLDNVPTLTPRQANVVNGSFALNNQPFAYES